MPLPCLMILTMVKNFLSNAELMMLNDKIVETVMQQPPYSYRNPLLSPAQWQQIAQYMFLLTLECALVMLFGMYAYLQEIGSGVILLMHVEGLGAQVGTFTVRVYGSLLGLGLVALQWNIEQWTDRELDNSNPMDFDEVMVAYIIGCLVVTVNRNLVQTMW